jgi:pimeloyl-ACP methyl ester carboxylesterase
MILLDIVGFHPEPRKLRQSRLEARRKGQNDLCTKAPKSWTERAYRTLMYFNEVDKGGHFAAWEQPQLFSEELRAAFRSSWPAALMRDCL